MRTPFRPAAAWPRDALAALVVSLAALSFYLSTASLVFQGPLQPYLALAIGATFFGGVLLSLLGAWRASLPLASMGAEPASVPVLATIAAATAQAAGDGPALLASVLAALALTAIGIGAAWWLLGRRGWGELMRYIPYPVVGGFLAAVGWLMFSGGLGVAMGQGYSWPRAWAWLTGAGDARLLVALGMGVLVWWINLRRPHPLMLPGLLLLSALVIHAGLFAAGLDIAEARARGWLLAPFERALPAWPWAPAHWSDIHWDAVLRQLPLMASAVIVATLGLLLSDSSLEVAWELRADFNADLRLLGLGNVACGALGGLCGGISISRSVLNKAAGAVSRASGALLALLCAAALLWGGPVVGLVPRPLLGGMLVFLAMGMFKAWVWDSRRRLQRWDYATVLGMMAVTATVGFLSSVVIGVMACCAAFVLSSSRLPPLRRLLTRRAWPSRVERASGEQDWLAAHGDGLLIAELQGALFFGSATQLTESLAPRLQGPGAPQCLLFDFAHARGLDSSAAQALARLFKGARRAGIALALSHIPEHDWQQLQTAGAVDADTARHADIDAAVGAWDDERLAERTVIQAPPFRAALQAQLPSGVPVADLLAHFERLELARGEVLFARGEPSDALYLVECGQLGVWVDGAGRDALPVRTVMAGSALGEMGLFRGLPRSATVRADQPSVLLRLRREALQRLSAEQPALAAALYELFVRQLASRVDQLTAQAHALAR